MLVTAATGKPGGGDLPGGHTQPSFHGSPDAAVREIAGEGVEIRSGGAVAVDTFTLRMVAARFHVARHDLLEIARGVRALQHLLRHADEGADAAHTAAMLQRRLDEVTDEAASIADKLLLTAAAYELVELDAAHQAAFLAFDAEAMERIEARRAPLLAAYPEASWSASGLAFERALMWPSELVRQGTEIGFVAGSNYSLLGGAVGGVALGGAAIAAALMTGPTGAGLLPRSARLTGGPAPVTLVPLRSSGAPVAPPASLAEAAARIPSGGEARVRVERYDMPDKTQRFAVYVTGTQQKVPWETDAWDMASNVELYTGRESASYTATAQALEAAGARPGDVVYAAGHSQGAMVVSRLALEGGYDTHALMTFGSPVEADVGPATLSVRVQHADDPVAGLAGGGHMSPIGASGSFVVETIADAQASTADIALPAHHLTAYIDTAAQVDASKDPRVAGLHRVLSELAAAESVEAFEFGAERSAGVVLAPGVRTTSAVDAG